MKMKPLLLLLSVVLVASYASLPEPGPAPAEPTPAPAEPTLRVVTYNINWGGPNPKQVARFLLESDAEVIFLQETHREWEAFLKSYLSESYPYSSFHSSGGAGGIAFMSKHRLSNVRLLEPDAGWFPALIAEVKTELGAVQILNVHLRPPLDDDGSATVSAFFMSSSTHQKELAHFLQSADMDAPLVIAGDFNENEHQMAIQGLLDDGFTDALSLYDVKSSTWSWQLRSGFTLKNRYDHILFNKHFHCTGAKVGDVRASDHRPVMAVLVNNKERQNKALEGTH